jgi:hypothetical protein
MAEEKSEISFLDHVKSTMDYGFWSDENKTLVMFAIERLYKRDVVREWGITDIVMKDDKVIVRWSKRIKPLTEEELANKYGT